MKWDVKIALYLFLAYALYGVSYLISDGDFVVPLPLLFIFIPVISLVFLFTSGFSKYSIFFLLLPLSIMSDKIDQLFPHLSDVSSLISIVSWFVLGLFLIRDKKYIEKMKTYKILLAYPIACWSAVFFFLNDPIISLSIFLVIGVVSGLIAREEEKYKLKVPERRLLILSSFISWMFLITSLSVYLA